MSKESVGALGSALENSAEVLKEAALGKSHEDLATLKAKIKWVAQTGSLSEGTARVMIEEGIEKALDQNNDGVLDNDTYNADLAFAATGVNKATLQYDWDGENGSAIDFFETDDLAGGTASVETVVEPAVGEVLAPGATVIGDTMAAVPGVAVTAAATGALASMASTVAVGPALTPEALKESVGNLKTGLQKLNIAINAPGVSPTSVLDDLQAFVDTMPEGGDKQVLLGHIEAMKTTGFSDEQFEKLKTDLGVMNKRMGTAGDAPKKNTEKENSYKKLAGADLLTGPLQATVKKALKADGVSIDGGKLSSILEGNLERFVQKFTQPKEAAPSAVVASIGGPPSMAEASAAAGVASAALTKTPSSNLTEGFGHYFNGLDMRAEAEGLMMSLKKTPGKRTELVEAFVSAVKVRITEYSTSLDGKNFEEAMNAEFVHARSQAVLEAQVDAVDPMYHGTEVYKAWVKAKQSWIKNPNNSFDPGSFYEFIEESQNGLSGSDQFKSWIQQLLNMWRQMMEGFGDPGEGKSLDDKVDKERERVKGLFVPGRKVEAVPDSVEAFDKAMTEAFKKAEVNIKDVTEGEGEKYGLKVTDENLASLTQIAKTLQKSPANPAFSHLAKKGFSLSTLSVVSLFLDQEGSELTQKAGDKDHIFTFALKDGESVNIDMSLDEEEIEEIFTEKLPVNDSASETIVRLSEKAEEEEKDKDEDEAVGEKAEAEAAKEKAKLEAVEKAAMLEGLISELPEDQQEMARELIESNRMFMPLLSKVEFSADQMEQLVELSEYTDNYTIDTDSINLKPDGVWLFSGEDGANKDYKFEALKVPKFKEHFLTKMGVIIKDERADKKSYKEPMVTRRMGPI